MKQKVVIKVSMSGEKSRYKAMRIAVGSGCESVALTGKDKDQIEVTGDGIDAAALTVALRKSLGSAELVSVGPVGEKKESGGDKNIEAKLLPKDVPQYFIYEVRDRDNYDPAACCSIM